MTAKIQLLQDDIHRVIRDHFLNAVGKHGKSEELVAALAAKVPVSERHFLRFLGIGGQSWPRKSDLYYLLETFRQEGFFADLEDAKFAETIRAAYLIAGFTSRESHPLIKNFCDAGKLPSDHARVPVVGGAFWREQGQSLFTPAREFRNIRKLLDHPDNRVTVIQLTGLPGCGRSYLLGETLRRIEQGTFYLQHHKLRGAIVLDAAHDNLSLCTLAEHLQELSGKEINPTNLLEALQDGLYLLAVDNLRSDSELAKFLQTTIGQVSGLRVLCAPLERLQPNPDVYEVALRELPLEDAEKLLCHDYAPFASMEHDQRRTLLEMLEPLPGTIRQFAARCRRLRAAITDIERLAFIAESIRNQQSPANGDIQAVLALLEDQRELLPIILERLAFVSDQVLESAEQEQPSRLEQADIHRAIAEQYEILHADATEKSIALIQRTFNHWKAAGDVNRAAQFLNAAAALGNSRESWQHERAWLLEAHDWLLEQRGWLISQALDPATSEMNILEVTRLLLARGQSKQVIERLETIFQQAVWRSDQRRIVFIQGELTANFINQSDYARARQVLQAMLRATERAGDKPGQAFALLNLALVANWSPDTDANEAWNLAQRALNLYSHMESHPYATPIWKNRADCLAVMSLIHRKYGQIEDACRLELQIRKLAGEHHDDHREYEAESYSREGFHLRYAGRYQDALQCYNRALQLHSRHSRRLAAMQLSHRANLLIDTDRFFDAIRDYEEARHYALSIQDWRAYSWISGNLGIAHLRLGNWQMALNYQQEALEVAQVHQLPRTRITQLTSLAETFLAGGIWNNDSELVEKAEIALQQALSEASAMLNIASIPPTPAEAYPGLGVWPDTPDFEMQSPGEYLRQGLLLVRLMVHRGNIQRSHRLVQGIIQTVPCPIPHLHQLQVWQGLITAMTGEKANAVKNFRQAITEAQRMLNHEPDYYPAQYSLGFARAGLALLDIDPKLQLRRTLTDYKKALSLCDAAGVVRDAHDLLQRLRDGLDAKGQLDALFSLFNNVAGYNIRHEILTASQ